MTRSSLYRKYPRKPPREKALGVFIRALWFHMENNQKPSPPSIEFNTVKTADCNLMWLIVAEWAKKELAFLIHILATLLQTDLTVRFTNKCDRKQIVVHLSLNSSRQVVSQQEQYLLSQAVSFCVQCCATVKKGKSKRRLSRAKSFQGSPTKYY